MRAVFRRDRLIQPCGSGVPIARLLGGLPISRIIVSALPGLPACGLPPAAAVGWGEPVRQGDCGQLAKRLHWHPPQHQAVDKSEARNARCVSSCATVIEAVT